MKKRKSLPTKAKIYSWWKSLEGLKHISKIQSQYGVKLGKLLDIEEDCCWACFYETSSAERCHVIPDSIGGSNKPSNIVLMCGQCHQENPDINDESFFWEWFAEKEHYAYGNIRYLQQQIEAFGFKHGQHDISKEVYEKAHDMLQPVLVRGRFSKATRKALIKKCVQLATAAKGEL